MCAHVAMCNAAACYTYATNTMLQHLSRVHCKPLNNPAQMHAATGLLVSAETSIHAGSCAPTRDHTCTMRACTTQGEFRTQASHSDRISFGFLWGVSL